MSPGSKDHSESKLPTASVNTTSQHRHHRKSRLGCKVCKARKIKCDEVRPTCGNCVRRFPNPEEECEFDFTHIPSKAPRSIQRPSLHVCLASRPSHSSACTSSSTELRLFYHYATVTGHTLPLIEEPCGVNVWTKSIPSIAFDCRHVYTAVLGLAALHLLSSTPNDVSLRAALYQYLGESISIQREKFKAGEVINNKNSPSIFATSMLLQTHAKSRAVSLATGHETYTPPLEWFHFHSGLCKISSAILPHIDDQDIRAYAFLHPDEHLSLVATECILEFPDDPFLDLWDDPSLPSERREIYNGAIGYLEHIKSRIRAGEQSHWVQRRLAILPGEVPRGLVGLLEEGDPRTLAILARFFALLKYIDEPWWLKGTAEFEVKGLAGLVDEDWKWSMQWPLDMLEGGAEVVEISKMDSLI
ncbi:hypothetical protein L207DRAFT_633708 [Hyaloscypha variabilis F]|uniref:Zn(2)-C6 fungal-type domain-containing protein n=1 Tax=Hyaloscypha variabilis (strain UAMH 11265 / GT02V1 / F) TaxID=1149755 RepID=A0A2J6RQE1_HYAVF|nr:hypothetical protein L207DRAFT_633708 [Hyaloscypha variabilis F]